MEIYELKIFSLFYWEFFNKNQKIDDVIKIEI